MDRLPETRRMTECEIVRALQAYHRRFISRVVPTTDENGRVCLDVVFSDTIGDQVTDSVANR